MFRSVQVLRFQEIGGKPATNGTADARINEVARDTKQLNELLKSGQALLKMKWDVPDQDIPALSIGGLPEKKVRIFYKQATFI